MLSGDGTAQEVEFLRRQLEELNGRMAEVRQQCANAAMYAAVTGLKPSCKRSDDHSWYTEGTSSGNGKGSKSEDETRTHTFPFNTRLVFRKLLTMSSVKRDVIPSNVGTRALGREQFCRMRAMLGFQRADQSPRETERCVSL